MAVDPVTGTFYGIFPNRKWVRGAAHIKYSQRTILHCDAFTYQFAHMQILRIEWREGGQRIIAQDTYLIEPDGLTRINELPDARGKPIYWTRDNWRTWAAVHNRVLLEATDKRFSEYGRVSLLCHYVYLRDASCEFAADKNGYNAPRRSDPLAPKTLGDMPKRPRGRPRKNREALKLTETIRVITLPGVCPITGKLPDVL